jgi:hypothetical protein
MAAMNINQALRRIAVLKGQVATWTDRLHRSLIWEDDAKPAWDYKDCAKEVAKATDEIVDLQSRVAIANAKAKVKRGDEKVSLASVISRLQQLRSLIALYKGLNVRDQWQFVETRDVDRYNRKTGDFGTEEKKVTVNCALPEKARDEVLTNLQEEFDELNGLVESANHTVNV